MSGNPFRRSKLPPPLDPPAAAASVVSDPAPSSTTAAGRIDTDAAKNNGATASTPPKQRTKKKRVTIVSPNSPEFAYRPADDDRRRLSASDSAGRADSPPPPLAPSSRFEDSEEDSETETDSTTTGDEESDEARRDTRGNSGALPPANAAATAAGGMKLRYNPFARTLATVEARNGVGRPPARDEGHAEKQKQKSKAKQGAGRPALDVDAFKNILMTGSAAPVPLTGQAGTVGLAPATPTTTWRHQDSSSNTDTSSLFDPSYDIHPGSPRTSFDDYEDASGADDGNEKKNLMGEGRLDDFAPPAPPKPKPRGPQTVSFAEFEDSIPQGFQGKASQKQSMNTHLTGILRPSTPRSMSDLNKPLPPPPREVPPVAANTVARNESAPLPQQHMLSAAPGEKESAAQKSPAPPPPPPSRRKPGETGRPRSASNNTLDSVQSFSAPQHHITSQQVNDSASELAPPPPPPSRKAQTPSHPSASPSNPTSQSHSLGHSANDFLKAKPPPPPRRHPSNSGSTHSLSNRTTESLRPAQRPGDAFLAAFTPAITPPAPPPRRGGSKRNSTDSVPNTLAQRQSVDQHRRSSVGRTSSLSSERSASIGSLRQVPEPGEEYDMEQAVASPPTEGQRDVLADMSAFQAEIEALRARAEGEGAR